MGLENGHDILLAIDMSSDDSKKRIPFYDKVGQVCNKLGYSCYLPHKEFAIASNDMEVVRCRQLYDRIQNQIMPNSRLIIAYMDIPSFDVGMMMGRAMKLRKPILRFYNKRNHEMIIQSESESLIPVGVGSRQMLGEIRRFRESYVQYSLQFEDDEDALSLLEKGLKDILG